MIIMWVNKHGCCRNKIRNKDTYVQALFFAVKQPTFEHVTRFKKVPSENFSVHSLPSFDNIFASKISNDRCKTSGFIYF